MSKVILLDYENDHDYQLIGIHTYLEDFRLAFYLNTLFNTNLKRLPKDLDFEANNASFCLYTYDCEKTFTYWSLIANKSTYVYEDKNQPLFSEQQHTSVLIKEKKQVDYFLKVEGEISNKKLDQMVTQINNVKNIITSYSINPQTLKSKDFLIF